MKLVYPCGVSGNDRSPEKAQLIPRINVIFLTIPKYAELLLKGIASAEAPHIN
jgi:hypothetical protein